MSLFDSASLVVTPNGYKEDKLYSIKPTDGSGDLVVTRATTATRVNSAGLIEIVPYNLLTYSEQFDNADWGKEFTTITANNIISPNGIQTADRFNLNGGTEQKFIYQGAAQNGTYTQSVYFKKGTHTFVQLATGGDVNPYCNFDLTNGTFAAFGSSATMTNVGNDWYRCTMTYTSSIATFFYIFASNSLASARTPATSSTGNFYAWGAQLVQGSSAKEYFPTTDRLNVPRIDYTNGSCPSILVEPQRTNLLTYSEQFNNVSWIKSNLSITANATTAPDGTLTADKLVENSSNANHLVQKAVVASNAVYTFSVFAKKSERNWVVLRGVNASFQNVKAWFNIDAGTIGTLENGATAKITNVGNGWYKLEMTIPSFSTGFEFRVSTSTGNNVDSYTGDGTSGLFIWGAQLEAGSYPTSYIPTVASSVTRNADVISKTGISSLIGQTEGTVFIEHIYNTEITNPIGADDIVIGFSNGTLSNLLLIIHYGSGVNSYNNKLRLYIRNAGADQALIDLAGTTTGTYKIAVAYKNNDVAFYVNGVQVGIDTSVSVPTLSNLYLYDFLGTNTKYNTDKVKSAAIWKTRLTNAELATLTTI